MTPIGTHSSGASGPSRRGILQARRDWQSLPRDEPSGTHEVSALASDGDLRRVAEACDTSEIPVEVPFPGFFPSPFPISG